MITKDSEIEPDGTHLSHQSSFTAHADSRADKKKKKKRNTGADLNRQVFGGRCMCSVKTELLLRRRRGVIFNKSGKQHLESHQAVVTHKLHQNRYRWVCGN